MNSPHDSKGRRIPVGDGDEEFPAPVNEPAGAESRGEETPDTEPAAPAAGEWQARAAEFEDRWKRAAADFDNYRKRFARELERLRIAEREQVLRAWLDVVDTMERALSAEGATSNPWFDGMEAIHQQMLGVLRQFGAEPFHCVGELFDPERHEAVATANLPNQPQGIIVEVVQTGYILDGKVLRHAKVIPVRHD